MGMNGGNRIAVILMCMIVMVITSCDMPTYRSMVYQGKKLNTIHLNNGVILKSRYFPINKTIYLDFKNENELQLTCCADSLLIQYFPDSCRLDSMSVMGSTKRALWFYVDTNPIDSFSEQVVSDKYISVNLTMNKEPRNIRILPCNFLTDETHARIINDTIKVNINGLQ